MTTLHWDDLQYFLAICQKGSIGAAAKWLGVNHSTVLRRIGSLEGALDLRLFDRLPSGYALTAQGHELSAGLAGIAEQIEATQRRLSGGDVAIQGLIRLTSTDTLIQGLLMPYLTEFHALHPLVQLQIVVNNSFLNLTQREADVAVRGSNRPPDNLIGRRAGTIQTALYASRDYIKSLGKRHTEDDYRWVALDESLAHLESAKWMRQQVPADRIAMRFDNLIGMVDAVVSGIGVGMLLCPLADKRPELVRLQEPMQPMDTQVWVLTHPDLKHVARIRALTDFLYERLSADSRLQHDNVVASRR